MKKIALFLSVIALLISANIYASIQNNKAEEKIDLLIIYNEESKTYLDIFHNYNQSLIINLRTDAISLEALKLEDIKDYHALYLDPSLIGHEKFNDNKDNIIEFVQGGGYIFLEDPFLNEFPLDFIGAKEKKALQDFPMNLSFPQVGENLKGLQELVRLFHGDLIEYTKEEDLNGLNKGHGYYESTAISLVKQGDLTIFGLNEYGEGSVFFANSLLPNNNYITGFDMVAKDKDQEYFHFTFATANYLFRNEFISYVSKEIYGYSARNVLGTYGRPGMVWQNHFEVGSAVKDGSAEKWIDVLKEYDQIPSYSLARSLYEWGEWQESITYHKNIGRNNEMKFAGEEENSHYSSGQHLLAGEDYLALAKYPEAKNLAAKIQLPYRAYPTLGDLNGDGNLDIISGSSDGFLYLFMGKGGGDFEQGVKVLDDKGNPIKVDSYSTPTLFDINKNGKLDLILGDGEGNVNLHLNTGNNSFKKSTNIIANKGFKNLTPTIGDIDGDGTPDLVVGESKGGLYFHKGKWVNDLLTFDKKGLPLKEGDRDINTGPYPAPTIYDIDGDGKGEIILGNSLGYIKEYKISFPNLIDKGYLQGQTLNLYGNKTLWGGYYSVPVFGDLNKDGNVDLIVGQIEFGLPRPMDGDLFKYKEELRAAIKYIKDHHIEIYPHVYFKPFKSSTLEEKELELHKKTFEYYDIPWDGLGVNQHTWNINNLKPSQTFQNEQSSGLKWNSGFRPSLKGGEPSLSWDHLWAMPFKLGAGQGQEDFILFSPSPNIPLLQNAYNSIKTLDMPISYFFHMEYGVNTEEGLKGLKDKAETLNQIRYEKDYNFMMEPQMFKAFEANMKSGTKIIRNKAKDEFRINLQTEFQDPEENDYNKVVGINFELGEKLLEQNIQTDSGIYQRENNRIYIGLNERTRIYGSEEKDQPHISRANGPIDFVEEEGKLKIDLEYAGLQEIKIYAPKGLKLIQGDFKLTSQGDYITLTRYGDKTTLEVEIN